MAGFWIKSTVSSRYMFTISCRKSPRYFSSSCYSHVSPGLTVVRRVMCTEQVKNTKHVRRFGNDQSSEQPKKQEGTHASDAADALPHHQHTTTILQRLHDLEESFRVRGHSILRWGLSALVVAGLVIYVFREPLRENVADEVADVASRSLSKYRLAHSAEQCFFETLIGQSGEGS